MVVDYIEEKTVFLLCSSLINGYFLIWLSVVNESDIFFQKLSVLSSIIAPFILISNFYALYFMIFFSVLSFFENIGHIIIVAEYKPSKYVFKKILFSFILESFMLVYIFIKEKKLFDFNDVQEFLDIQNEGDEIEEFSIFQNDEI